MNEVIFRGVFMNRWLKHLVLMMCLLTSCAVARAASLRLMTEDYPPFNMYDGSGKVVVGMSTDVVREMLRRAGMSYTIELQPWIRSFNTAVLDNNTCVFSTTRTDAREHQFKWVGPVVENPWVLYAGPSSPSHIATLEDARRYTIGGYSGDAVAQFLIARGFNVELTPTDDLNARKLAAGHIDFWATGKFLGDALVHRENLPKLKPVLVFNTALMYLACNPRMPDSTINQLNALLVRMHQDGFFARVTRHYLSN